MDLFRSPSEDRLIGLVFVKFDAGSDALRRISVGARHRRGPTLGLDGSGSGGPKEVQLDRYSEADCVFDTDR